MLLFSACSGGSTYLARKKQSWNGYYTETYGRFNGENIVQFTLKSSGIVDISVATISGRLDLELMGKDERGVSIPLYEGEDLQTGTSQLHLEEGDYTLVSHGENHSGGITIDYQTGKTNTNEE